MKLLGTFHYLSRYDELFYSTSRASFKASMYRVRKCVHRYSAMCAYVEVVFKLHQSSNKMRVNNVKKMKMDEKAAKFCEGNKK